MIRVSFKFILKKIIVGTILFGIPLALLAGALALIYQIFK